MRWINNKNNQGLLKIFGPNVKIGLKVIITLWSIALSVNERVRKKTNNKRERQDYIHSAGPIRARF